MRKTIILIQIALFAISSLSCGDKPKSEMGVASITVNIPHEIEELIGNSAELFIYDNGRPIANDLLSNIRTENRLFLSRNLGSGKHNIAIFLTGPNPDVVYMLDRKDLNLLPDIENIVSMELAQPIKFNIKILNLSPNQEVVVEAKIDSARLPHGVTSPQIFWTIDNILNGNEELGTITAEKSSAIIRGPSTLPSSVPHYLGAYYELEGKKFISVVKINYIQQ